MSLRIRDACKEDCSGVIELIQGLADYENMSDYMILKEEEFRKDGFGERPFYRCVVAEIDLPDGGNKLVGYSLGYFTYSTFKGRSFFMEDLYVHPDHRGIGAGTKMWKRMAQIAVENNCQRMDFIVLNWNQPSIDYYKRKGCVDLTIEEKWHLFRMPKENLERLAKGEN